MASHKTTTCRSCGAEIIWAWTSAGRRMPVDAKPEIRIVLRPGDPPSAGPRAGTIATHTSHFATCPDAGRWRRGIEDKRGDDSAKGVRNG